jgi:hypothetical protein
LGTGTLNETLTSGAAKGMSLLGDRDARDAELHRTWAIEHHAQHHTQDRRGTEACVSHPLLSIIDHAETVHCGDGPIKLAPLQREVSTSVTMSEPCGVFYLGQGFQFTLIEEALLRAKR